MATTGRWHKPILTGRLVTLRPVSIDDAEAMWEMVNDREGNELTGTTASFTFEQIREWCATRDDQDDRVDLAIVENVSGQFAGEAVLNEYDAGTESANFRIALRGPKWYGRGLGTEATRLIVDHGFSTVGLRRITLEVLAGNRRAQRVYEKSGFRRSGETVDDGTVWVRMERSAPDAGDSV